MRRKELLAVMLPVAAGVLFAVVVIVSLIVQATSQEQPEDAGEVSNGTGMLGVPPQSTSGEELRLVESSNSSAERGDEMSAEAITETDDFVLTISVERASVSQGMSYRVDVEVKNVSGENLVILNDFLLIPPPGLERVSSGETTTRQYIQSEFRVGSSIGRGGSFRNNLEKGAHELQFTAEFSLLDSESGNFERISILSNPVVLISTDDFVLTISMDETTMSQGEDIMVNVALANNSGEDHEIASYFLFYPHIPGNHWVFMRIQPPFPSFQLFESGGTISRTIDINHYYKLSEGTYQLTVTAHLFLNWEQPADPENEPIPWATPSNAQRINIVSNTVVLIIE